MGVACLGDHRVVAVSQVMEANAQEEGGNNRDCQGQGAYLSALCCQKNLLWIYSDHHLSLIVTKAGPFDERVGVREGVEACEGVEVRERVEGHVGTCGEEGGNLLYKVDPLGVVQDNLGAVCGREDDYGIPFQEAEAWMDEAPPPR